MDGDGHRKTSLSGVGSNQGPSIFSVVVLKWRWYILYKISYYSYSLSHLASISSIMSVYVVILCQVLGGSTRFQSSRSLKSNRKTRLFTHEVQ